MYLAMHPHVRWQSSRPGHPAVGVWAACYLCSVASVQRECGRVCASLVVAVAAGGDRRDWRPPVATFTLGCIAGLLELL